MNDEYSLQDLVGDAVTEEIARRAQDAQAPLTADDERRFARSRLVEELRRRNEAKLARGQEPLTREEENDLIEVVLNGVFGFGELEQWLSDPEVTDIFVNGHDSVFLVLRDGSRKRVGPVAASDEDLKSVIADFARRMGRIEQRFDYANPIIDMQLPNGDRLHAIFSVADRPSMSIRRHNFDISSLAELTERGAMDPVVGQFLKAAVRARRNMVISGSTGSGKTTLLRALINEIGPEERIVTVEDNLELGIRSLGGGEAHPNCVQLEERSANVEGVGAIPLKALVKESLRMKPDRIFVGECRGAETVPMLLAMSQGNDGSMTTIHADSSKNVFNRITTYAATMSENPIDPSYAVLLIRNAIHFVVHLAVVNGTRVIESIREVDPTSEDQLLSTEVFAPDEAGRAAPRFGVSSPLHKAALEAQGFDCRLAARA